MQRRQFQWLARRGRRVTGEYILLHYTFPPYLRENLPRLGISVSTKYGKAFRRNRFKRVVRDAFRHCCDQLPKGVDINVRPGSKAAKASSADIQRELLALLDGKKS